MLLANFFNKNIKNYESQYIAFGIFGLINYSLPFFMWEQPPQGEETFVLIIRFVASLLCFFLIIKDNWHCKIKKYLPLYWHITLAFCVPFFITMMLLKHCFCTIWLVNLALGIFLLSTLLEWISFIIVVVLGFVCGVVFFKLSFGTIAFALSQEALFLIIYVAIFSIMIGAIFSRNREYIQKQVVTLLESKVAKKTKNLENALKVRKEFLNNMSHEIRTPLQGILGISQGLNESWDKLSDIRRRELNNKIFNNSKRLMVLVSNLLDVSKLESGKMGFNFDKYNVVDIIQSVIDEYSDISNAFEINLVSKLSNSNAILYIDKERIIQVVRNLISNAIKFGKNSDIEINIHKTRFTYKKNNSLPGIQINVIDQGIGIANSELDHIFNPFTESSRTKTIAGGTGLGLSICNEIINAHQGVIFANSNEKTTTFSFILPSLNNIDNQLRSKNKSTTIVNKSLTILVVDDEDACLTACSLILSSLGHNVIQAYGGDDALTKLKNQKNKIDMVFLDLMMPDIYGINVLREIKSSPVICDIPVVIQSGISDKSEINRAFNHGAAAFITKPYLKVKIKNTIEKII